MRISGCVFQQRNIIINSEEQFRAKYKGKEINISMFHNLGEAKFNHLTRFRLIVLDIKSGITNVDTYEDCHNIRDAIRCALKGVELIQS